MDIVDPRPDPRLLPARCRAVVIAEHQQEFQDLPSVRTPRGQVITRWSFTDEERAAIVRGEDLYITILSPGPVQPIWVTTGPMDWARVEREQLGGEG